eukprot:scaffold15741_cov75-Skeletonema_dohrnii-CCMP3373.AAC.2
MEERDVKIKPDERALHVLERDEHRNAHARQAERRTASISDELENQTRRDQKHRKHPKLLIL